MASPLSLFSQALLKEVQEHKAQVESLNEGSSSLLELVPWRAREGLDKMVTEVNERYKAAGDAISQHVDAIGAAILKSQQVTSHVDPYLPTLLKHRLSPQSKMAPSFIHKHQTKRLLKAEC